MQPNLTNEYLDDSSDRIESLCQRLRDTASYLRGLSAVIENMNKGASEGLDIAIHAVEAVSEDLETVRVGGAVPPEVLESAALQLESRSGY
jgi:hypothetical protein